MIYNLPVRALTVLILKTPGVKLDKMLLSFHGWNRKGKRDSCGRRERTAATTPAGKLNTKSFPVIAKEPPTLLHTHTQAHTHLHFDPSNSEQLEQNLNLQPHREDTKVLLRFKPMNFLSLKHFLRISLFEWLHAKEHHG